MNIALRIDNVFKQYGNHIALDNVNLSIPEGSIYGLLGPNGAGKTTLMRIINQITAPDKGYIYFNNEKLQQKHIKEIGYLPEERGLYKKMKAGEQALYLAQLKGMSYREAKIKLKYWFEKFEIINWWDKKIEELSKGMAQKIQFIVTVMHDPKVLIFDEPFSGFDPINASIIREEILELNKKGATIIFSTHRMESVEEICTHIGLINKSRTILEGSLEEIKKKSSKNNFKIKIKEGCLSSNKSVNILKQEDKSYEIKILEKEKESEIISDIVLKNGIISYEKAVASIESIFIENVTNE
tara:strand:+ start:2236 stop:3129 length:894 start_codon:yes stop_codon:yes gene_type:complete